ncbi:MAG: CAP domain-containing protein [Candidatus Dormibacteraeota bacterium]|nr:CAP domain-containing protein [Candidatus Dormibacteraeota bacterium]
MRRRFAVLVLAALLVACDQVVPKPSGTNPDAALDLMFHNQYAKATVQLQNSLKTHPHDARLLADYALVLNYQTKQPQALDQALAAQKQAPTDGYVETILTRVQDWNNNLAAATAAGAAAIKASPNSALAHAFYGEALADVGKYTEALAQLQKGADLAKHGTDYDRAEVERNWGNFYRDKKDYPQALIHLKLAAGAQPGWVERLLELARFSIARQDLPSATGYLQRAASLSPDDAGLREQLGDVALFAQDYAVAKTAYRAALQLQPRNALDLKILGQIAVALDHDPTGAAADERAALAAQPTDQEAGAYLVAVLRYLSKNETAALDAAQHLVAPAASPAPASTYVDLDKAAANREAVALTTVNRYRKLAGLPPVGSSPIIHQSALAHAYYTFFNAASPSIRDLGIHKEQSDGQGYVGDNVLTRAQHFGYPTRSMAEVITHRSDPAGAVSDWIDSVYHRFPILRADLLELGYGDAYLGPLTAQVMDMSYRETSTGQVILYPAPNQTNVPVAFNGNEIPDPAPNAAYPIGYPVTATFDRNARVKINSFQFRGPSGGDIAGVSLMPGDPATTTTENSFAYLANTPLQAGTTYSMAITGTINGVPFSRSWKFTTQLGASPTPQVQQAASELNK